MRFTVDQVIAAAREAITAALEDEKFYAQLGDAGSVRQPELLGVVEQDDGTALVRVQHRFGGNLSGPAARILDPDKLSWVIASTVDRAEHRATFVLIPDHDYPIECKGSYRLEAMDDAHTRQRVEGDVRVRYPIVGGLVERAIVSGLTEYLEHQAQALSAYAGRA